MVPVKAAGETIEPAAVSQSRIFPEHGKIDFVGRLGFDDDRKCARDSPGLKVFGADVSGIEAIELAAASGAFGRSPGAQRPVRISENDSLKKAEEMFLRETEIVLGGMLGRHPRTFRIAADDDHFPIELGKPVDGEVRRSVLIVTVQEKIGLPSEADERVGGVCGSATVTVRNGNFGKRSDRRNRIPFKNRIRSRKEKSGSGVSRDQQRSFGPQIFDEPVDDRASMGRIQARQRGS